MTDFDTLYDKVIGLLHAAPRTPKRIEAHVGDASVLMEWHAESAVTGVAAPAASGTVEPVVPSADTADTGHLRYVVAPMIGTFYCAPEPGADPFVTVGEVVSDGQQVGILETMKLMNPLKSELAGRVVEVLVADGTAVEYGQRLVTLDTR
jgi:acetyl-CoA carboxylase biotin carboxyl carrier protein